MATVDKGQKMPGEAFHKLRSDHEQFLEAYEKPTQIYRFLKARHSLKPLFLHRNLSYMRMRGSGSSISRSKRRRKLRVNELIGHTKDAVPDLATEIKSDNHLEISFSGLEPGVDYNELLAEGNGSGSKPANRMGEAGSGASQLVEIEILLYSFNQPSAEALLNGEKDSFKCTCSSLGKRVIHYSGGTPGHTNGKSYLPLTIPESSLTWKHRQGPGGTQLLVFRASYHVESTDTNKKMKKSRKNGTQGKSIQGTSESSTSTSTLVASDLSSTADSSTTTSSRVEQSVTGEAVKTKGEKVRSKPEMKDASCMTDIRFGTDVINELTPTYQSQIDKITSASTSSNQPKDTSTTLHNGCKSSLHKNRSKSPRPDHSRSNSPSRQDKCTSPLIPKLTLRNGVLNGYISMNGYAAPTVTALRKGAKRRKRTKRKLYLYSKSKKSNSEHQSEANDPSSPLSYSAPEDDLVQLLHKNKQSSTLKKIGSGKQGTHSFLVSIPRSHYNTKYPTTDGQLAKTGMKNFSRSPRRTEVQLLLDGDKPRGQRVSGDQVPKFTAEDVSSWSTNSAEKSSWLGSSTRKITPVEHYNSPFPILSPKRALNGGIPSLSGNHRKRSHSEECESSSVTSPRASPPQKCSRLESPPPDTSPTKHLYLSEQLEVECEPVSVVPKCAPDRKPAVRDCIKTDEVFCAELAVFDSRGDCLLGDGEYAVIMQKCLDKEQKEASDLLVFEPLSWSSVFGEAGKRDTAVKKSRNLLLKFSLNWTDGPPQHQLCSNLDTALDLKKIRECYYPPAAPTPPLDTEPLSPKPTSLAIQPPEIEAAIPLAQPLSQGAFPPLSTDTQVSLMEVDPVTQPPSREKIFFNFLYGNNSVQQTECREDMQCPWCYLHCPSLYSLLKHLSLCHPRFQFTYSPSLEKAKVIEVHVNKLYDTTSSLERDPGENDAMALVRRRQRPAKTFSCTCVLVDRSVRGADLDEDLSEFLNDGSWRRGYDTNRMYYHSNSSLPMLEDEIMVDSEGEESTQEWQKICCQKMLDDFTDVNKGEKRLMKLWNLFVMEHKLIAEKQIPKASVLFAQEYRDTLLQEKIDRNFLSHLISLYDFGLISPSVIRKSMAALYAGT